jgi:hypothetical protein
VETESFTETKVFEMQALEIPHNIRYEGRRYKDALKAVEKWVLGGKRVRESKGRG